MVIDDEVEVAPRPRASSSAGRGYDVQLAESGLQGAGDAWRSANPQVVLLDVTMPEMDGVETLRQLLWRCAPGCRSSW